MGLFKDALNHRLSRDCPDISNHPVDETSSRDSAYNCFAYVANVRNKWWTPDPITPVGHYWPVAVAPEEEDQVSPIIRGYATLGFEPCEDGTFEDGYEKLAIYVKDGVPKHVAIQRNNGLWQSKMGHSEDICHRLESLQGGSFGEAKLFMCRIKPHDAVQVED